MPRYPRYEDTGATHHVVLQGNGRGRIVSDDHDRRAYLDRFVAEATLRDWIVHASALLDTHHHAVLTTPEPDLGTGIGRIAGGHAAWLNARHERTGAVFSERFWSRRADRHVVQASVYTLVNPVAAGLARHPREWPWCNEREIRERGCSPSLAELTGGTGAFLDDVDAAVDRIAFQRRSGRAVWSLVGEVVEARRIRTGGDPASPRRIGRG